MPARLTSVSRLALWLMAIVFGAGLLSLSPSGAQDGRGAVVLHIEGAIGPATVDCFTRELEAARDRDASVVIIRMDTPGGLVTSMREIVRDILASDIPVITYVGPSGARATSAGTYILYASHVAAMAPGTHVGSATPVQVGGGGGLPFGGNDEEEDEDRDDGDEAPRQPANASEAKAIEDSVAYIVSLAELRGRNAEWAEKAVREAASLSSSAALEQDVIDFTATSLDDVLDKADGMRVNAEGEQQAAAKLAEAAEILSARPEAMQLRYLSTLNVIAAEQNSTIVFPFPMEFVQLIPGMTGGATKPKPSETI